MVIFQYLRKEKIYSECDKEYTKTNLCCVYLWIETTFFYLQFKNKILLNEFLRFEGNGTIIIN